MGPRAERKADGGRVVRVGWGPGAAAGPCGLSVAMKKSPVMAS